MVWWRRDPSVWCRSPLHRYVGRIRDNEAVLRSRCFSKSQPTSAQHKDDEDKKRTNRLSSLQWVQLQQYRQWKRRLQEDPYQALFGASNDMLDGKGLKDWQWVYRSFPKWVIKEMDAFENQERSKSEGKERGDKEEPSPKSKVHPQSQSPINERYPLKPGSLQGERPGNSPSNPRESVFSEPSLRPTRLRPAQHNSQIVSPSDTRRPQEQVVLEVSNKSAAKRSSPSQDTLVGQETNSAPSEGKPQGFSLQESSKTRDCAVDAKKPLSNPVVERANDEALSRESTFISEFLTDSSVHGNNMNGTSNDWQQTVLDRRLVPKLSPRSQGTMIPQTEPTTESPSPTQAPLTGEQFWPAMANRGKFVPQEKPLSPIPSSQYPGDSEASLQRLQNVRIEMPVSRPQSLKDDKKLDSQERTAHVIHLDGPRSPAPIVQPARTTSDVLRQLPEDDLDFLSADEIRGSMRAKRNSRESLEERQKTRTELETQYKKTDDEELQLHPMIASNIVNDQHVRRTVREMKTDREADKPQAESLAVDAQKEAENKQAIAESPKSISNPSIETSLDRMTRWLQDGRGVFAKHFWSEPTLAKYTGLPSDQQHQTIVAGIRAGRTAMEQVEETIETVVPSSKPLLARLRDNESSLIRSTRFMLGPKSTLNTDSEGFKPKSKMQNIRNDLKRTEEEFEKACETLEVLKEKSIPNSSKQGLHIASVVLQKNAKLTRRIVFRIQSLEENPGAVQHAERFKEVKNRLSALQDTQLALLRLIERAIQLFGPLSQSTDTQIIANLKGLQGPIAVTIPGLSSDFRDLPAASLEEESISAFNTVLNQKLENEVAAQKSSMHGLSDDGYTRSPKPSVKEPFDNPRPLANSLFRPFNPLYESLGKEEATPGNSVEPQPVNDKALVQEIRKSYEDIYGAITVNHKQTDRMEETQQAEVADEKIELQGAPRSCTKIETSELVQDPDSQNKPTVLPDKTQVLFEEAKDSNLAISPPSEESWVNEKLNCQGEPTKTAVEVDPLTPTDKGSDQVLEYLEPSKEIQEPQSALTASSEASPKPSEQPSVTSPSRSKEAPVVVEEEDSPIEAAYKILTYDPNTDELYITTTTSKSMATTRTSIPLHEALSTLDAPAKFVPHISSHYEVVASKPNLLVLRESTTPSEEILRSSIHNENEARDEEWKRINPVDGTTRLSPTGFVGIEPDLRDEHDATRRKFYETWKAENERREGSKEERARKTKKRGNTAGVFKTAIIASAGCYIAGVIGELLR